MLDVNFPTFNSGDQFTADQMNEVVNAIRSLNLLVNGKIPNSLLPGVTFNPTHFEITVDLNGNQTITLKNTSSSTDPIISNIDINNSSGLLVNTTNIWTYPSVGSRIIVNGDPKMPSSKKSRVTVKGLKTNNDTKVFIGIHNILDDNYQSWKAAIFLSPFQGETYIEAKQENQGLTGTDKKATVDYISIAKSVSGALTLEESTDGINWTVIGTYLYSNSSDLFVTFSFETGGKVYYPQLITY